MKSGFPACLMSTQRLTYDVHSISPGGWWRTVPEVVELVLDHGHEIGCHGYDYSPDRAFDLMDLDAQMAELKRAKDVIEAIAGRNRERGCYTT